MICGICGITPKVEIAQRNTENVLALKNIEVGFSHSSHPVRVQSRL